MWKKLATPFVKIWDWIKETAWVQPLLIVGIIFAVIFSIPSITSWVSSWDFGDDTYTWLEKNQLSLEGITDREIEGEAAEFFESFNEAQVEWSNGNKNEARQALNKYVGSTNKMFLYFVKENDGQESFKYESEGDEDYWIRIAAGLKDNFTMEKVDLLKSMSKKLYPIKEKEFSFSSKYLPIAIILGVIAMGLLILLVKK